MYIQGDGPSPIILGFLNRDEGTKKTLGDFGDTYKYSEIIFLGCYVDHRFFIYFHLYCEVSGLWDLQFGISLREKTVDENGNVKSVREKKLLKCYLV